LAFAVDHEITDHIHPFLTIIVDGQQVEIPSDIGLKTGESFSPHTHDKTGKLHIGEGLNAGINKEVRYVTLKDFFDVWRTVGVNGATNPDANFSSTQLMGRTADANNKVFMTVNGVANTEFESFIPEDNDQIVLSYGPAAGAPTIAPIADTTVLGGSPLLVPLDGYDPTGGPITFTVTSSNPTLTPTVIANTPSWRVDVDTYGQMVFQLLPGQAQRPVDRVVTLTNQNFYNGLTFHRVINNFVIQGGDPAGNGTGGSDLGDFDDQFNVDLQHNRTGLLSYAKSSDDTNDSQFFITEGPQRHLDFNHSIYGVLVEGETVREAISNVATNASNLPLQSVVIDRATTYTDNQNAVLLLKAPEGASGTADVTVTARDSSNNTTTRTFRVTITPDTVNGGPFLNDVPTIRTSSGTPATFTLSSQDVEGNAVVYTAAKGDSLASTVSVNAATGQVTATPPAGYVGNMLVRVGVQAATGQPNDTGDKTDSQLVSIAVAPAAPTGLDLPTVSDLGSSSTDNITSATSMSIQVSGVTNGATVALFNGATKLGEATASGTTVSIPLSNVAAGTYSFTAKQTVSGSTSDASPALQVVIDTTAPTISSFAVVTGRVGQAYSYNVASAEEGTTGFRYELVTPPTGMAIDPATGVIAWTPLATQGGTISFGVRAFDAAGNSGLQNVTVAVSEAAIVSLRLAVTDANGNPLNSVRIGDTFQLRGFASDVRPEAQGVYAVYQDIEYDGSRASVLGPINYIAPYTVAKSGATTTSGLIDELGAASAQLSGGSDEVALFSLPMKAELNGTLTFSSNPADSGTATDILVFGLNTPVPPGQIDFGTTSINVLSSIAVQNDTFNVNEDSAATTLNVLSNDSLPTGSTQTLTIASVGTPSQAGNVTIAADGRSLSYTPAPNFFGDDVFTYEVTAGTESERGTVTVTVQPVNDPPTAVTDNAVAAQNSTNNIIDVLANDIVLPDQGESLRVTAVGTPTNGSATLGPNGGYVIYSPRGGFAGVDLFTYTLSDGNGGTDTTTITVSVNGANDAPIASDDVETVQEDSDVTEIDVLANDLRGSAEGQPLSVTLVDLGDKGGTVSVNAQGTRVLYKPAANFFGTETFTYTVTDTLKTAKATVTVTVTGTNDAPTAVDDTLFTGRNVTAASLDVLANDLITPDADETLVVSAITQPTNGTLTIAADGRSVLYTPNTGYLGADTFTYTVRDPGGLTDTATVNLTVRDYAPSSLKGMSFVDINSDGLMQPNESPLANVKVELTGTDINSQSVTRTTTTDSNGQYQFMDLPPGNYTVRQFQPATLVEGVAQVGTAGGTASLNQFTINLPENIQATGYNFSDRLAPKQFTLHDFLAKRTVSYFTAAVDATGAALWHLPGQNWVGYSKIILRNATSPANSLEIRVTPSGGAEQTATVAISDPRVRVLDTADGATTYRIFGHPNSFNFQPVAIPPANNTSGGSTSGGSTSGGSTSGGSTSGGSTTDGGTSGGSTSGGSTSGGSTTDGGTSGGSTSGGSTSGGSTSGGSTSGGSTTDGSTSGGSTSGGSTSDGGTSGGSTTDGSTSGGSTSGGSTSDGGTSGGTGSGEGEAPRTLPVRSTLVSAPIVSSNSVSQSVQPAAATSTAVASTSTAPATPSAPVPSATTVATTPARLTLADFLVKKSAAASARSQAATDMVFSQWR
jgi:cyclophilin family peptidyl-prolyl cis-trans isomerase